jgi:hypothetical protein
MTGLPVKSLEQRQRATLELHEVKSRERQITEHRRGEFVISTDKQRLDVDVVHGFLTECYWAQGIPREVVARISAMCLCWSRIVATAWGSG